MLNELKYLYLTASRCKESPRVSCHRHSYNYSKLIDAKAMVSVPVDFDSDVYTAVNPDLTGLSNEEAVAHFIKYGVNENRYIADRGILRNVESSGVMTFRQKTLILRYTVGRSLF